MSCRRGGLGSLTVTDSNQASTADLAVRLADLLAKSSPESMFHLETALRASELSGVGGSLIVQLPRRVGEHVKIKWAGGSEGLSLPL